MDQDVSLPVSQRPTVGLSKPSGQSSGPAAAECVDVGLFVKDCESEQLARGRAKASRASSRKEVRFADAAQTPSTRISVPNNFCWRMQPEFPTFVVERSPLARLQHSIGRRLLRSLCALQRLGS